MTDIEFQCRKVVLIAGAGSEAGEATARRLASAGHHVVLGERQAEPLIGLVADIRRNGGSAECFALDVTRLDHVREFVAFAQDVHKRADVIINQAAVIPLTLLSGVDEAGWRRLLAADCQRHESPAM
jgi:NADP-dependent 3-hydroxy acid dehydrogenase YdfG